MNDWWGVAGGQFTPFVNSGEMLLSATMRIVVRDSQTGLYFAEGNGWVRQPSDSTDFEEIESAARVCRQEEEGANRFRIVLRYEEPQCELSLRPEMLI